MTKDYVSVYEIEDLSVIGYTDSDFQANKDERRKTSGYVNVIGGV